MKSPAEVILAVLPGAHEDEQVEVVLHHVPGEGSKMELRHQTWGEGVGWFTQSRVELDPHQVADLRAVLGSGAKGGSTKPRLPRAFSQVSPGAFVPRVVHADSA